MKFLSLTSLLFLTVALTFGQTKPSETPPPAPDTQASIDAELAAIKVRAVPLMAELDALDKDDEALGDQLGTLNEKAQAAHKDPAKAEVDEITKKRAANDARRAELLKEKQSLQDRIASVQKRNKVLNAPIAQKAQAKKFSDSKAKVRAKLDQQNAYHAEFENPIFVDTHQDSGPVDTSVSPFVFAYFYNAAGALDWSLKLEERNSGSWVLLGLSFPQGEMDFEFQVDGQKNVLRNITGQGRTFTDDQAIVFMSQILPDLRAVTGQ